MEIEAFDPRPEQRRLKRKRNHPRLVTSHLQLYRELKPINLKGLILGTAVYICTEESVVSKLDALCFGNLDGGLKTAMHVKQTIETQGCTIPGETAVRIALDEAFFMSYSLGLLQVYEQVDDGTVHLLDNTTLWQRCNQLRSDFLVLYLAYQHFRSKGWICRTGLQYGADLVLYQRHPAIGHSEYSVLIIPTNFGERPPVDWHDFQVLNRLTTQVSKQLLLFYIEEKPGCDKSSPECMKESYAVQERLIRRWVPEAHRG